MQSSCPGLCPWRISDETGKTRKDLLLRRSPWPWKRFIKDSKAYTSFFTFFQREDECGALVGPDLNVGLELVA